MRLFNPVPPGDILRAYMADTITVTALAKHLGVPRQNLSMVLHGRLRISAAVALRLSEAFPQSDPRVLDELADAIRHRAGAQEEAEAGETTARSCLASLHYFVMQAHASVAT